MADRISIRNCDIVSEEGLSLLTGQASQFPTPNVVVFNNVFQFFVGKDSTSSPKGKEKKTSAGGREKIREIWGRVKAELVKGCVIVAIPSLKQQFEDVGMAWDGVFEAIEMDEEALDDFQDLYSIEDIMLEDIRDIHLYRVV